MLYSIETREDMKHLNELYLLQHQVNALGLQHKLKKWNFHEDIKKVFEPFTKPCKDVHEDVTRTLTKASEDTNKALENLNDKIFEKMYDRGILTTYLLAPLSKITNPEHTSQVTPVRDLDSKRANDLLINKTVPVTLCGNLLTFRDTEKKFEREKYFEKGNEQKL